MISPDVTSAVERVGAWLDDYEQDAAADAAVDGDLSHVDDGLREFSMPDLRTILSDHARLSAALGEARGALKDFIDWGQQQCPCRDETPSPARCEVDEHEIRVDLFGEVGADRYEDAIDALHLFAHATDCPPGNSVIQWFDQQMQRLQTVARETHAALSHRPKEATDD